MDLTRFFKTSILTLLNHLLFQSGPDTRKNFLAVKFHNNLHPCDQVIKSNCMKWKSKKSKYHQIFPQQALRSHCISLGRAIYEKYHPGAIIFLGYSKKKSSEFKITLEAISSKLDKPENQFADCIQTHGIFQDSEEPQESMWDKSSHNNFIHDDLKRENAQMSISNAIDK